MMARCGRPELDSCPRVVGGGAPARKRRRLVLAPPKCARNPPPETTATQNTRANSRKPKQPAAWTAWKPSLQKAGTAARLLAPGFRFRFFGGTGYTPSTRQRGRPRCWLLAVDSSAAGPRFFFRSWTAWKPSLQKAKTAARLLAPGFRFRFFGGTGYTPSARWRGRPRGSRAVARQARQARLLAVDSSAAGPRFSVPVFWRDGLHPVHAVGCWLLVLRRLAPGFFFGHGRRGSRPSRRQEQPNSTGLNAPGYRTAESCGAGRKEG